MSLSRMPIRLGFVQLCDAAPYILAGELGYFQEAGLTVELSRELGWATIRSKIALGELDAAHALATLPLALSFGLCPERCAVETSLVTSHHGNAITLGRRIYERGVHTAEEFRQEVLSSRGAKRYLLGVVSPESTHHLLLRAWLQGVGLKPQVDVQIVTIPPGQALRNLRAGTVDGFCVGEPWNFLAVRDRLGWIPALGETIQEGHPEKVLMARQQFAREREDEYLLLGAAILRACAYCAVPENAAEIARVLTQKKYIGNVRSAMERTLTGPYSCGEAMPTHTGSRFRFYGPGCNALDAGMTRWLVEGLRALYAVKKPWSPDELEPVLRTDRLAQMRARAGLSKNGTGRKRAAKTVQKRASGR
ncbi:MAG: CmpA/NrtA family ABC transporter substrate-binding protein [Opitutales bacterium]